MRQHRKVVPAYDMMPYEMVPYGRERNAFGNLGDGMLRNSEAVLGPLLESSGARQFAGYLINNGFFEVGKANMESKNAAREIEQMIRAQNRVQGEESRRSRAMVEETVPVQAITTKPVTSVNDKCKKFSKSLRSVKFPKKKGRCYCSVKDSDGNLYYGEISGGKRNGYGMIVYSHSLGVYWGQWSDDMPHGEGKFTAGDESVQFVGLWKHGELQRVKEGYAKMKGEDGFIYKGTFLNWKRHGEGILIKPSGEKYVGCWRNGYEHGPGELVYPDGHKTKGIFRMGQFVRVIAE